MIFKYRRILINYLLQIHGIGKLGKHLGLVEGPKIPQCLHTDGITVTLMEDMY